MSVVSLNILHGFQCPPETDHCQAPDRVALLGRLLTEVQCPEVVALQEVSTWMFDLLEAIRPGLCGGRYRIVTDGLQALDTEVVLTTLAVRGHQRVRLAGAQRTSFWVGVTAPMGPVDIVVTHVGAGADGQGRGGIPCGAVECPTICPPTGPVVSCQVREVIAHLGRHGSSTGIGVVVGDFNVVPDSQPYNLLTAQRLVDTYLAAGNPECDPASGLGCTGGRDDKTVAALQDPLSNENERIDYAFLRPGRCRARYREGTGLFADQPTADGPGGLAWPSDHVGTRLVLTCR
jgi:endonuclease/exonuclease/phosphatase family metal-dependent hydrolase